MIFDKQNWLWKLNFGTFWHLHQFSKFNHFLWVCWFLGKNISDLLPPAWKIDNLYYHSVLWWPTVSHSVPFVIISTSGLSVYKLKEDLAWPLFLLFVERKENKQFQFCLKNQEVFCGSSLNIYERNLIVIRMMDEISIKNPMPGPWLLQTSLVQFSLIRSF